MDLASLDRAFLYITGLVNVLLGLTFALLTDYFLKISMIPLLILGIIMPFYIGYLRGAISFNCIYERMRGWIYLLAGLITYAAFLVPLLSYKFNIDVSPLYLILMLTLPMPISYIVNWFVKVYKLKIEPYVIFSFGGTMAASIFLAISMIMFIAAPFAKEWTYTLEAVLDIRFPLFLTPLVGFIIMEKVSRIILHDLREKYAPERVEINDQAYLKISSSLTLLYGAAFVVAAFAITKPKKVFVLFMLVSTAMILSSVLRNVYCWIAFYALLIIFAYTLLKLNPSDFAA